MVGSPPGELAAQRTEGFTQVDEPGRPRILPTPLALAPAFLYDSSLCADRESPGGRRVPHTQDELSR